MANALHNPENGSGMLPPKHIAIIMDGNGRWAKKRMLPRKVGHRKGADAVRRAVKGCGESGVSYLTLYAFSSENWKRSEEEINDLMGLLRNYLRDELEELTKRGVRLRIIGERDRLADDIVQDLAKAEATTQNNSKMTLIIALNYGARAELVAAAKSIAADAVAGKISVDDIEENMISDRLFTHDIPDPDLIIRTSGEHRLSNFLLWQIAYSEFLFLDILWPDVTEATITQAIEAYHGRERRYGGR